MIAAVHTAQLNLQSHSVLSYDRGNVENRTDRGIGGRYCNNVGPVLWISADPLKPTSLGCIPVAGAQFIPKIKVRRNGPKKS